MWSSNEEIFFREAHGKEVTEKQGGETMRVRGKGSNTERDGKRPRGCGEGRHSEPGEWDI